MSTEEVENSSVLPVMNCKAIEEIGGGNRVNITLVEHKGEELAREEVDIGRIGLKNVKRKVNILKELNHENILIVKDSEVNKSDHTCYIYAEYLEKGNLSDLIKNQNNKDFELSVYLYYVMLIYLL